MATVYWSKVIDAPANETWRIVRDFGAIDVWFPFIKACRLKDGDIVHVGSVRVNTVDDGTEIEEVLLAMSDRDREIVFAVTAGNVPTIDYSSTIRISEVSADGGCFAEWTAQFDVDGEVAPVAEWVRGHVFETCLNELERVAKSRHQRGFSARDQIDATAAAV